MRKLGLALLLFAWAFAPAQAQTVGPAPIICNQSYQVSQGATALTKIVTGTSSTQISICGWALDSSGTSTAQLEYGTGTNCGTGTTALTPAINLAGSQSYVDHIPYAFKSLPRGNDLCLVTTGAGTASIVVYYGQY